MDTLPKDEFIAEALRLTHGEQHPATPEDVIRLARWWYDSRNILARAATLEKLAVAEAERDAAQLEFQARPLFSTRQVMAERDALQAKLQTAVEALGRIGAVNMPGEFMTSEFCKRVATEALAAIQKQP